MQNSGTLLAICLAVIHAMVARLDVTKVIPEHQWISFAGGVSIGYVFLEIFPELSHAQAELEHSLPTAIAYLEHHVYLMALLGLLVFFGIDSLVLSTRVGPQARSASSSIFWVHIAIFVMLNGVFGYLLQNLSNQSLLQSIFFFIAVALHFFVIDHNLREHHESSYDHRGRWFLTGAILLGALMGQVEAFYLNEGIISLVWSFIAGSIILHILKRELPDEKESCFWCFMGGAALYTGLLLLV